MTRLDLRQPKVSRELLLQFVRDLGFDPNQVKGVTLTPTKVTVTEYHLHPEHGGRYSVPPAHGVVTVTHTLYVDDDQEDT